MKVRTDAKRDAILAIASKAFLELGYERTSMSEISARVGGSKATLYGYFQSKEALFKASTDSLASAYFEPALAAMSDHLDGDPAPMLRTFSEQLLVFYCSADVVAAHRMVMAESGHSEVGRLFYEAGPRHGVETLAGFLRKVMDNGGLRQSDAVIAAQHFIALTTAEVQHFAYLKDEPKLSRIQVKRIAARAVEVFVEGYRMR